ncbi:MAG: Hsp70 family protein [Anaerolineales bacterium]|nr:Hsp70 family protein [Anaerolineales bacterium]
MKIGVDFGTTHTSAAYFSGDQLRFVPLDEKNDEAILLRSMLYITREQDCLLGRTAVETYLREDTGRIVRFEDKFVGTVENTVAQLARGPMEPDGPITIIYDVVVAEDVSTHGRLIQSIKTALRDPHYEGTNIFGDYYSVQELIALILRHVRQRAEAELGQPVDGVLLGRPVRFNADPMIDALAQTRLHEAAQLAGFTDVSFEKEPLAAARFYTHTLAQAETIFVFDFGGGTLDMTLMKAEPGQTPEILATHGVLVGGDDLDSALMRGKVAPYFGTTAVVDAEGSPFPHNLANLLGHWQTIPRLSRPENLAVIRGARRFGSDKQAFAALENLVTQNYGFQLFEHVERSKRALSTAESTRIDLHFSERIDLDIPISRREFQRAIVAEVAQVQQGLTKILAESGLAPTAVDTIVTTGGSSLIPLFQTMLTNKFPTARLVQSNTFGSVTAGLALQAAESD